MASIMNITKVEENVIFFDNGISMPLSKNVKSEYIRPGEAEVSIIDGEVTFIKKIKSDNKPQVKQPDVSHNNLASIRDTMIVRQSSLKCAVEIVAMEGIKENITSRVKNIAADLTDWVLQ